MAIEDGTGGGGRQTWANIAKIGMERAIRENRQTWCLLLDSKAADVLAETDPDKLYMNLQLLAEIARAWQEDIEVRKEEKTSKKCVARVPDNGDNMACDEPILTGDFCEKHAR